jgi:hypothetical protein
VKSDGTVIDSVELERPLAELETARLYAGRTETYLLTVDYTAEAGSYNGPITSFVEVHAGGLRWLEATDRKTGKTERLALMRSLKSAWKLVPGRGGSGQQILQALCRPWGKSLDNHFVTMYRRYFFDGKAWIRLSRETQELTEFDGGFPDRRLFP